jgi:hypothetical protein
VPRRKPGQCLDDIIRRSAGLPAAIVALFLSEPPSAPRRLLPEGVARLLAIAQDASLEPWPRVRFGLGLGFCVYCGVHALAPGCMLLLFMNPLRSRGVATWLFPLLLSPARCGRSVVPKRQRHQS